MSVTDPTQGEAMALDIRVQIKPKGERYQVTVSDRRYNPILIDYADTPSGCMHSVASATSDLLEAEGVDDGD